LTANENRGDSVIEELENERGDCAQQSCVSAQCEYMDDQKRVFPGCWIQGNIKQELQGEEGDQGHPTQQSITLESLTNTEPTGISIKFAGIRRRSRSTAVPMGSAGF
jgi:hypothetical protein